VDAQGASVGNSFALRPRLSTDNGSPKYESQDWLGVHVEIRRAVRGVLGAQQSEARKETGLWPVPFLNLISLDCRASGETEPVNDCLSNSDHCVRLHRCLCVPGSSPCKTPGDHHVVQMEQSLVGRSRSRSQVCHGKKPADNRSLPHLGRSSLPDGKACSAWGSNNRVPGRTPDPQR